MAQTSVCRGTATKVHHTNLANDGSRVAATYHGTTVAQRDENGAGERTVTLNSGGWQTATTKTRINQFSHEFCSGAFTVYQTKGEWFVSRRKSPDLPMPFFDGMQFAI